MLSHSFRAYIFLVCAPLLSWNVRDSIWVLGAQYSFPLLSTLGEVL